MLGTDQSSVYPLEHKELENILNEIYSFLIHKSFQSWWKDICFLSVQYQQETKKYNVKIENQNAQHRCTSMKEVVLTFSTTLEKSYFSNAASHLSAYSSNGMTYKIPFWGTQPTVLIISLVLLTPTRDTCLVLVYLSCVSPHNEVIQFHFQTFMKDIFCKYPADSSCIT